MCTCSPKGQSHPELHPKQHGQQLEEWDSDLLHCSGETPPGMLHSNSGAGPQHKKYMDLLEQVQRRAMKMTRELKNFLYEDRQRVWIAWHREENALGRPYSNLPVPKGPF